MSAEECPDFNMWGNLFLAQLKSSSVLGKHYQIIKTIIILFVIYIYIYVLHIFLYFQYEFVISRLAAEGLRAKLIAQGTNL